LAEVVGTSPAGGHSCINVRRAAARRHAAGMIFANLSDAPKVQRRKNGYLAGAFLTLRFGREAFKMSEPLNSRSSKPARHTRARTRSERRWF
jgi:hypothetical protein